MVEWHFKWLMCWSLFLAFAVIFNGVATHNMCVFQLDPRLKGLQCIKKYVNKDKIATIVEEYD